MIHLFCPTRGRPQAAAELYASFRETAGPGTRLVFLVDDDDQSYNYRLPEENVLVGQPAGNPVVPLNRAALDSEADIVGFIGDDSRLVTPGWDALVERALREPGYAWGCDETGPPAWPSTAFVSTDIVRKLGYFALPTLRRGFFDRQWLATARGAGIERVIKASFPHRNADHPVAPEIIAADELAFQAWLREDLAQDVEKARRVYDLYDLAHFFP